MTLIDNALLDAVTAKAQSSERLRMNYNLHESLDDKVQKLLNALEPGTIVPIHRHTHTAETYFVLRGALRLTFYNELKEVIDEFELSPNKGKFGVDIHPGQWHSLEVLESGTVIFEVKEGPYTPFKEEDILR